MNADDFNHVIEAQIERSTSVLINKAAEYATDDDRLHNFKVAAAMQGCTPSQALVGMMAKHTTSIFDMVGTSQGYTTAMWNEKITDHINYLLLLRAVVEEEFDRNAESGEPLDADIPTIRLPFLKRDSVKRADDWHEIVFASRGDAEDVRDHLHLLINGYGHASVYELFELVGTTGTFADQKRGWTDISKATITKIQDGYWLALPNPEPLPEDENVAGQSVLSEDETKAIEDQTALNDLARVLSEGGKSGDIIRHFFDIVDRVRVIEPSNPVSFKEVDALERKIADDEQALNNIAAILGNENNDDKLQSVFDIVEKVRVIDDIPVQGPERINAILREEVLDEIVHILNSTNARTKTTAAIAAAISKVRSLN